MSRPLRIDLEHGLYHVTARGWERRALVRDDTDRQKWFELLDRVVIRYGWRGFAWVLMDNHYHLFLQTPEANLSEGMHDLNSGYATWFNRRHRRYGSLFQGRFKAILVEDESYCWSLSRYIHLNPYRAKLVSRPEDHRWSSYRYYLDSRQAPEWLDWQSVLREVSQNRRRARNEYRRYVEAGLRTKIPSPLKDAVGKLLLGSADWVEKMQRQLGLTEEDPNLPELRRLAWRPSQDEVEHAVAEEFAVDVYQLHQKRVQRNEAREAALYLIRKLTSVPANQLATQYGPVSPSAISKTIQRAELRCQEQQSWNKRLRSLEKRLQQGPASAASRG